MSANGREAGLERRRTSKTFFLDLLFRFYIVKYTHTQKTTKSIIASTCGQISCFIDVVVCFFQGFLKPCHQVSSLNQVFVEPLSSDDWEILVSDGNIVCMVEKALKWLKHIAKIFTPFEQFHLSPPSNPKSVLFYFLLKYLEVVLKYLLGSVHEALIFLQMLYVTLLI